MKAYRRLLRCAALPILDRKWAAPLSAVAVGFGLFIGVAIGPGATGSLATGAMQIVEVPGFGGGTDEDPVATAGSEAPAGSSHQAPASTSSESFPPATSSLAPLSVEEPESGDLPAADEGSEQKQTPPPDEESEAEEETLKGVVVHLNKAAGSYTVAEAGGTLVVVHASTAPQPGTEVEVPLHPLANGTYGEAGKRVRVGAETRTKVSGIVTFVHADPAAPAYAISKRGVSMLVHVHPDPSGATPALPEVGAFATVAAEIEKSDPPVEPMEGPPPPFVLWQRHLEVDGTPLTYGDFAGIVTAVNLETNQLQLSADDVGESGTDLLFALANEELDLSGLEVGRSVVVNATIGAEGALSATGLADDEHRKGADDAGALQGDLAAP
jgi:phage baseplate assembly protein gpV